jgi:hypothetical protein
MEKFYLIRSEGFEYDVVRKGRIDNAMSEKKDRRAKTDSEANR